jgi:hypothetical protein
MTNKNNARIDSVKLLDDLSVVFPAAALFSVQQVTATGNLLINTAYNGKSITNMLLPASSLAAGKTDTVKLAVKLSSELSGTLENKSTMEGKSQFGWLSIGSNDPFAAPVKRFVILQHLYCLKQDWIYHPGSHQTTMVSMISLLSGIPAM